MEREEIGRLPAVISSVSPQKKNKERYSVFVGGEFLIGVSESTLLEFRLAKGTEITPSLFRKIQRAEGRHAVKSYCLRMLSRRDHSRSELFAKSARKDFAVELIDDVLDELERKDYLNDRRFAVRFASDKAQLNSWGPAKIRAALLKKGVTSSVAEEAVSEAFETLDMSRILLELVQKRRNRFLREKDLFKRKKKIFDYLRQKGYNSNSITKMLDKLAATVAS